jgi:hypothetical protein
MTVWEFANNNPFSAFCIALCAAYAVTWFPYSVVLIFRRYYRHKMVIAHGWPTAKLMDADGDIVHPKCKCDD